MNAGDVVKTCKSSGIESCSNTRGERAANGCVTREEPALKFGIAQGNLD